MMTVMSRANTGEAKVQKREVSARGSSLSMGQLA
jgi:hypothetical protein